MRSMGWESVNMSDLMQHYLDRYAKENFISEYKEYLKNPNGECPYDDIDSAGTEDEKFYNDITEFLTISIGDSKYEFERPEKSKRPRPFAIKFRDMDVPADHIYLTSDQFGFSVPCRVSSMKSKSRAWNGEKNYPYARYLSVNCDDAKGADDLEKIEFVARCIYETRTIGGSFLWPKVEIGGKYLSRYNTQRGEKNYIRDRVDITLYEIKCFYDVYSKLEEKKYENFKTNFEAYAEDKDIILFNSQGEGEKKAIYRWLSIFETFERYVEKLKFDDFVIKKMGEYLIRDMASERALSPLDITKIKKIQNMDSGELKILLENVKECTESRSEKIQEFVIERRGTQ